MDAADAIAEQVAQIRKARVLGRSHGLERLFDYLADPANRGRSLREADVALDVFGRTPDLSGDASVRVYIHRLRRKLEAFYAGPGAGQPCRLTIPVGQYRLDLVAAEDGEVSIPPSGPSAAPRRPSWLISAFAAGAVVLAGNVAAWAWLVRSTAPARQLALAAASPLWAGIGRDRPVLVVVGDYYIFGDTEGGAEPRRMIRAFEVNSPADLDAWLRDNPRFQNRYIDLDTYYTPVGATVALSEIMPLVRQAAGRADRVRVVTASRLTPDMLKASDIVYVGYLSGLRVLQPPVFERSRFAVGATYDELVDRETGETYVSGAGKAQGDRPNRDYGYLAAFTGAAGNRFLILAGARDIGVIQTAELAADPGTAAALGVASGRPVEALYEVDGVGRAALEARPVVVVR
ncbi:helix-turn-helix domain-containing protein [Phenylobacterium sp.]|uniref:helix-turn-helix domain-containing protein n=1 Tax=Phenylobacterium sp. TaxID=1871053 RepID=UPI00301C3695